MKRKAISQLLQIEQPTSQSAELLHLMPEDGTKETDTARLVLAAALESSRKHDITTASDFYFLVCSSQAAQLMPVLEGTPAAGLSKDKIARSQAILNNLLTSKAGRPKQSDLSRPEQLAAAQARRREKLGHEEGRKQVNEWISPEAAAYLNAIKEVHGCKTRADALEMVLQAAIKGQVLKAPAK